MIPVTHLRQNVTFLHNNQAHKVLNYSHTHMGRGGGTIRVKVKNLETGTITEETFKSGDKVTEIDVIKKEVQFLYLDKEEAVFMDPFNYEQFSIELKKIEEQTPFLSEGLKVWVSIWNKEDKQEVLDLELPAKVVVKIQKSAPGEKGNSAQNSYKEAVTENGLKIKVPLFIGPGDSVRISTTDASYVERA